MDLIKLVVGWLTPKLEYFSFNLISWFFFYLYTYRHLTETTTVDITIVLLWLRPSSSTLQLQRLCVNDVPQPLIKLYIIHMIVFMGVHTLKIQ